MACKDIAREVETFACAFERAHNARVEDFLPPREHPAFADIGLELLRIDLEQRWHRGSPQSLEQYRRRYPGVLESSARFGVLAFEEYRQRREAGETVEPSDYARQYSIDVSEWFVAPSSRHSEPAPPEAAKHFPEFEIVEELGRGAFARVFLARQRGLAHRHVVLKISRGSSVEPDRLAKLQHSNIVPIYSVHDAGGYQALCMPYLGRSTLAHVIGHTQRAGRHRSGRDLLSTIVAANESTITAAVSGGSKNLTALRTSPLATSIRERFEGASYVDAVVWIVASLADGLAHAHERGILHRDLKPANVLFSDDGRPMILDFNLSDQMAGQEGPIAAVGGTVPYMSPEQLDSLSTGGAVDVRSDIYSLGVMMAELLTGVLPFQTPRHISPADVAAAAMERRCGAPAMSVVDRTIPQSISDVVARCLAPAEADRYQTARHLHEDVMRHLQHRPLLHAPNRSPRERIRKWVRRHPRASSIATIGGLAVAAIVLMTGVWMLRERHFQRIEARSRFQEFTQQLHEAKLPLSIPGVEIDVQAKGRERARTLLAQYGVLENPEWRTSSGRLALDAVERRALDREVLVMLQSLAGSTLKQAFMEADIEQKRRLVDESRLFNSRAVQVAAATDASSTASLAKQQRLIERIGADASIDPSELEDADVGMDGPESLIVSLLRKGRYGDALPRLITWRNAAPTSVSAWMLLGVAQAGIGNSAEAEECFTTCISLEPQFAFSYFQRGVARHQSGKYSEAVQDFTRYIELHGASPSALINRAIAYHALTKNELALQDLNAALVAGAKQTRLYFIRAAVRRELGEHRLAQTDYEQGLLSTPADSMSWLARGMAQLSRSPELALADFKQAMLVDPANRLAAQNTMHVLSDRLHRDGEALEIANSLVAGNPHDSRALITRAVLRSRRGDVEPVQEDVTAATTMTSDPLILLQAGCALAQISERDARYKSQALQFVARAVVARPALALVAEDDPDLAPIRTSDAFRKIIAAAEVSRGGLVVSGQGGVAKR